jgi:hypothetical protein
MDMSKASFLKLIQEKTWRKIEPWAWWWSPMSWLYVIFSGLIYFNSDAMHPRKEFPWVSIGPGHAAQDLHLNIMRFMRICSTCCCIPSFAFI